MHTPLPRHPFVPFRNIVASIADKYVNTAFEKKVFLFLSKVWAKVSGIEKLETPIADSFARGENGYFAKYRRFSSINYSEFSASFVMNSPGPEAPARKASKLIVGALKFRDRVLQDELAVDHEAGLPLDMRRYPLIFSRLTVSSLKKGEPLHEVIDVPPSEHIIVAIDGLYYKLQVLRAQQIIPVAEIYQQITNVIADARAQLSSVTSDRFPFGLFTIIQNKDSIGLAEKLSALCPQTIAELTHALFFIAIDLHDHPQNLEKLNRVVHWENFHSRDYRRSIQLVVTGNGRVGLTVDPNAGMGGGFGGRFLDELARESAKLEDELKGELPAAAAADDVPLFQRLKFNQEILAQYHEPLSALSNKIYAQFYPEGTNTVFRLDGIGKKDFTRFGISADGAFHAALHLTFYRCFGRVPYIGNFISLRAIEHGEIFRYNATTAEMQKFTAQPGVENLIAALRAHKVLVKQIKRGDDPIYQCEMLLVTLFNRYELGPASCLLFISLLSLFIEEFNRRFMSPDMWVSHIPEFPGVETIGRPGVKISFLAKNSLAGHYMLYDHHTMICFVGNPGPISYAGREAKFAAALRDSLCELRAMLESQGEQASSTAK